MAELELIPPELRRLLQKPPSPQLFDLAIFLRDVLEQLPPDNNGARALFSLAESIGYSAPEIAGERVRDAAAILNGHFGPNDPIVSPAWQAMLARLSSRNRATEPAMQ